MLGYDSTLPVTMDDMVHHTKAVARGARHPLIVADLPFGSYQASIEEGVRNATRLVAEGGAAAVKIEGGASLAPLTAHLTSMGIPVMSHIGLTPQSLHQLGGYKVQGRGGRAADQLVADAVALADAGAFSVLLEAVPSEVGRRVTEAVQVPTVGIGAGPYTTGQVLVVQDMLGLTAGRLPRFVKPYANLRATITEAVKAYASEVADSVYPAHEHQY
jgi:3-methyl-2-oxobutanoate hydroxymethyltransferase